MSAKDQPFDLKGVKQATVSTDIYAEMPDDFHWDLMKHSFYLPVDMLQRLDWLIEPVKVITGKQFNEWLKSFGASYSSRVHCDTSYHICSKAIYVGVSRRHNHRTKDTYYCCKVWYGKPIQKLIEDIKLEDL